MRTETVENQPVISRLEDFDPKSGNLLERILFNNRWLVIALCVLATVFLAYQATKGQVNASFDRMIPTTQPFMVNFRHHRDDLASTTNVVRVAVSTDKGTIFNKHYLSTLQKIYHDVYTMPNVHRAYVKSLWSSSVRWLTVSQGGLNGGPVIPESYDGSPKSLARVKTNVLHSTIIGKLVAPDFKSSVIHVPLFSKNLKTGKAVDYQKVAHRFNHIMAKYDHGDIRVHVTGFAMLMGDLIDGVHQVVMYFFIALGIAVVLLLWYTRCWRSTVLVLSCSLIAVIWQVGIVTTLGFHINPYSVLVPFLVFAIGLSHGSQKMNGILQDVGRGTHKVVAARYTFRRLFAAGVTALIADTVGFAVLLVIDIPVIRDLAILASVGVAILIITNLMLLPILLSYVGVSPRAARRSLKEDTEGGGTEDRIWRTLRKFTEPRWATAAVIGGVILTAGGLVISQHLQVGDLGSGAPELRPNSRYNRDLAYMNKHYAASSDLFIVMVTTPRRHCQHYSVLSRVNSLSWRLEQLDGVQSTDSLAHLSKRLDVAYNDGSYKWYGLTPNNADLGEVQQFAAAYGTRYYNSFRCSFVPLYVYLANHKAATLTRVVDHVQKYAAKHNTKQVKFLLAGGTAGIQAATNIAVEKAQREMLVLIYAAVLLLSWIALRSWRAVLAALIPLGVTSILAEVIMVFLGIGVTVGTLPVIALGVGIGVDYALYILSVTLSYLRQGQSLQEAYYGALRFTGRVVLFAGATLTLGVATWVFSPIQFQANMGLLLAFMFLWNMVGALVLLPALAYFLFPKEPGAMATAQEDQPAG